MTFGELLRQLRKDAGLTLDSLAARSGVAVRTISDLELGKTTCPHELTVARLVWGLRLESPVKERFAAVARGRPPADGLPVPSLRTPPRTLPRDIASFAGREPELARLTAAAQALADAGPGPGPVVNVQVIGGMAGIGKTALAIHAAHRLAPRFPDGQVFLALHSHTPGQPPVPPGDALASLLQAAGIDAQQIPAGLDARARLWRHWLAGKRLLLVLDDVADSDQIRPLLPGAPESLVLITSRRRLTALEDAHAVSLDPLPAVEAEQLLVRLAARPSLDPADPALGEIARLCGCLPLALGILGRQLHHHPAWTPAGLAADLAAARDRLELMQAENLSVAAALDLSYRDLGDEQQRMFRCLGLHPGTDLDAHAAAALTGRPPAAAGAHLTTLYNHHLMTELAPGRYRSHDLVRQRAQTLAAGDDPGENEAAAGRLARYYQHAAARAAACLAPGASPGAVSPGEPPLRSRDQALAWLRAERGNLLGCLRQAGRRGQQAAVVALTAGLAPLLRTDGPVTLALELHTAAAEAAQRLGDLAGEAAARRELGTARELAGDHPGAVQAHEQALGLYRALGDRAGEGATLNELGVARQLAGDYPGAAQALDLALSISRDLGDMRAQASSLRNQGFAYQAVGDYPAALRTLDQALDLCLTLGDQQGEAHTLDRLGFVRQLMGDYPGAAAALERALDIYTGLGHRLGQANALIELGAGRRLTGDFTRAADMLERALGLYQDVGHRLGEASTLNELGVVRRLAGDLDGAAQAQEQALAVSRGIGDPLGEASALNELGVVRRLAGDLDGADWALAQALGIVERLGHRQAVAEVLNNQGELQRDRGQLDQALAVHQRALGLARAVGVPLEEARATEGTARCALAAGQRPAALAGLRDALTIYQRLGSAQAHALATELAALEAAQPASIARPVVSGP